MPVPAIRIVPSAPPVLQRQLRLHQQRVAELARRYEAGDSVRILTRAFNVNRETVLEHLKRERVARRPHVRKLTEDEIERLADEVASTDYDVEQIRRRGRPRIGSGPAQLVPVRLDPELLESLRARALRDHASNSEIIRAALREYLAS